MTIQEELKNIYISVSKMDLLDLKKAYEQAETQEELEFYKELFTFQLQQKQKIVINQKDFVI
ncbi:hypothetical protein [Enterococcus sp. RIT-PI-f]|uniref:hypothetical protein n=1 Tax=Enterococcus sp. RIT-PI-f TaxID=1690244 RepID=UPI0006B980E3|nr:hypothetical protein [Enterococcus sp. RIT-PI-f]KPG70540.1 hypothetical protein AEQ18_08195 [Enterococcus sp. RIT-PI-f]